jgi:MFS family permease
MAAVMTTVAMGLGSAVAVGDLRILAANISIVRNGLQFSPGTTVFVSSLATLALAASVLGAGVLGDRYGMKRMFVAGASGAVAFGFLGAAAPNVAVLMIARAGIGVAFAFLTGLSLAIMNAVFPPDRRAAAIARYLAAVYAFGVVPATLGGLLAERIGWRAGLLVTPVLAILVVVITLRYVPETQTSHGRIDVVGLLLVAVALVGLTYGISRLQGGLSIGSVAPIATGALAAAAFVWWELRCDDPALDLRIFRSARFNAVVFAGGASNLVQGAAAIMVTFYLVVIRGYSTWAFALLLIPATLLSALAALGAGRAAARFGNCAVVVAGLLVLAASLVLRSLFGTGTPIVVVAAVMALMAIGGAIVQTPQTTVMMSSAPVTLGGVVSAVKASVAGTFYGLGSALFSMFGIILFTRDAGPKLAGTGITAERAGEILGAGGDVPGGTGLDPERTQWVISQATSSMVDVAHTLNLAMTAIPIAAAVGAVVLFRHSRAA